MRGSSNSNILWLFIFFSLCAGAQQKPAIEIAIDQPFVQTDLLQKRKITYLFAGKNGFVKYNPVSLVLGGMLMFYQAGISHLIGAACPFEVNCSDFSRQCIHRYGILKGIPLTTDRLTRCTRIAFIDLVPGTDYSPRRQKIYDDPADYARSKK